MDTANKLDEHTSRQIWRCAYYSYFHEPPMKQEQIAPIIGISRPQVSRYLRLAEQMGMIKVIASPPRNLKLETQLIERFGLRDARVALIPEVNAPAIARVLGGAAAEYFEEALMQFQKDFPNQRAAIGVAGGRAVHETVQSLTPGRFQRLDIYPLVSGPRAPVVRTAAENVALLYAKYLSSETYVYELQPFNEELKDSPSDARVNPLEAIRGVDFALIGIGNIKVPSTLGQNLTFFGIELDTLRKQGIVGDICLHLLHKDGIPLDIEGSESLLGISLEALRNLHQVHGKQVIAISGGLENFDAIWAALCGGGKGAYLNILITDNLVAERLLTAPSIQET